MGGRSGIRVRCGCQILDDAFHEVPASSREKDVAYHQFKFLQISGLAYVIYIWFVIYLAYMYVKKIVYILRYLI